MQAHCCAKLSVVACNFRIDLLRELGSTSAAMSDSFSGAIGRATARRSRRARLLSSRRSVASAASVNQLCSTSPGPSPPKVSAGSAAVAGCAGDDATGAVLSNWARPWSSCSHSCITCSRLNARNAKVTLAPAADGGGAVFERREHPLSFDSRDMCMRQHTHTRQQAAVRERTSCQCSPLCGSSCNAAHAVATAPRQMVAASDSTPPAAGLSGGQLRTSCLTRAATRSPQPVAVKSRGGSPHWARTAL